MGVIFQLENEDKEEEEEEEEMYVIQSIIQVFTSYIFLTYRCVLFE